MNHKTIYIVGAGAIGKALAVFLSNERRNVVLIRGSVDHMSDETQHIQIELNDGSIRSAEIDVRTISSFNMLDGLIVLTNKAFGNETLAKNLLPKIGQSPLMLLQNGLDVEKPFIERDFPEVYRCVLFPTCQSIGENIFRFKPVTVSPIGVVRGAYKQMEEAVQLLKNDFFSFALEPNIETIIWKKVITNCVFNSVCPLLEIDNGVFHRNDFVMNVARKIIQECIMVAHAAGINLESREVEENIIRISRASDGQLISTLQDIRGKRPTEIRSLNFAVAERARSLRLTDSVSQTRMLGELTLLKSELSLAAMT